MHKLTKQGLWLNTVTGAQVLSVLSGTIQPDPSINLGGLVHILSLNNILVSASSKNEKNSTISQKNSFDNFY